MKVQEVDIARIQAQIRAQADGEAEVLIYGDIGEDFWGEGVSAQAFVDQLRELEAQSIHVRINSGGGLVWDGFAIYQALVNHRARVRVSIDSVAASAASLIAMAGDEIRMAATSLMMMHEPQGFAFGDAEVMRKQADLLDDIGGLFAEAYAARSGESEEKVREWMSAETWFTASEAVDAGFADEVFGRKRQRMEEREVAAIAAVRTAHDPREYRVDTSMSATLESLADMRILRDAMAAFHERRRQAAGDPPPAPSPPDRQKTRVKAKRLAGQFMKVQFDNLQRGIAA